ncbi:MAG: 50S ribosomal protein L25 [Chthoniobacterales bacterium]|nr:50S ribosomal protein L25 [Chthoniobacterales bacterium]
MSNQVSLKASHRTAKGRNAVKKLKNADAIPAILYGSGVEPTPLQLERRAIDTLLSHAVGENILVNLEIDGGARLALINEVQHHPVNRAVLHVDFQAVSANQALVAEVVIEPVGEAAGVKTGGGLLEQSLRSIEVECLPKDLPEMIKVDVSALNLGDALHVRDLPALPGVKYVADPEVTVFLVSEPKVSEEGAPAAEGAAAEPEVIREKKAEEGEGAGAKED